jgi:CRP-like cAMP-binding protein
MIKTGLRELSANDIDWMMTAGHTRSLEAGETLLRAGDALDATYLVLTGRLSFSLPPGRTGSSKDIATLSSGDMAGLTCLLNNRPLPFNVIVLEPATVLVIPCYQMYARLEQDIDFSVRFYRSIALLLLEKQQEMVKKMPKELAYRTSHNQSIFPVFSCLQDTDICWMIGTGKIEKFRDGSLCTQAAVALNQVYITLKGVLHVLEDEEPVPPSASGPSASGSSASGSSVGLQVRQREIVQFMPGEIVGISQVLDFNLPAYTLQASQDSLVLAIPRPALIRKLNQDAWFASRFYRAAASLIIERIYEMLSHLCYGDVCYEPGDSLHEDELYEDELDIEALRQASVARARFNWMLQHLGIKD